jgi:hypothetical protein
MVAMLGRALPPPVPGYTALRLGKNELLAEMAMMESEGSFLEREPQLPTREPLLDRISTGLRRLQPAYRLAMLSLVVVLAGGFFTLSASASGMADSMLQNLFYSFEQVGELLLVNPGSSGDLNEGKILSGDFGLPDAGDYQGDFKAASLGEDPDDPTGMLPGSSQDSSPDSDEGRTGTQVPDDEGDEDLDEDKDVDENEDKDVDEDEDKDVDEDEDKDVDEDEDKDVDEDEDKEKDDNRDKDKDLPDVVPDLTEKDLPDVVFDKKDKKEK